MNQAQYYTDFVEGRLDEESLKEFTKLLAIDRDFLSGFQNFLVITQTISSYTSKIKAPDDFTEGLFARLGFSLHPGIDEEIVSKEISKKNASGGNFLKGLCSGLVISALVIAFIYLQFNTGRRPEGDYTVRIKPSSGIADNNHVNASTVNKESIDNSEINTISKVNKNEKNKIMQINNEPVVSVDGAEPPILHRVMLGSGNPVNYRSGRSPRLNRFELTGTIVENGGTPINQIDRSNISIEFNNSAVWNLPQPQLRYRELSPINNLCLSIFYHFDERIKAGLEVRQESYFMDYLGTEPDSILYKYSQHSNFLTIGARAAYQPVEFFNISPTIQLGLGVNRGGYALRPGLGLEYRAYSSLSFYFGAEYTKYWFVHQAKWNNTSKIGLNYGLAYKF